MHSVFNEETQKYEAEDKPRAQKNDQELKEVSDRLGALIAKLPKKKGAP